MATSFMFFVDGKPCNEAQAKRHFLEYQENWFGFEKEDMMIWERAKMLDDDGADARETFLLPAGIELIFW